MANSIERIGVYECGKIAEQNNWMFREQPINDIGIDAHMERVDSSGKPNQLLALQIKTGTNWFKEEKDGCIIFRDINERQYYYWTTNSLPCILVMYDPEKEICIWQKLTARTIERTKGGKGFFVKVPKKQVFLDKKSNEELLSLTNLPEHVTNYNFLLSQKVFMQIIAEGGQVKLHAYEWVNKSSGKGNIELIVDYEGNSKKYSYPYWFPMTPYTEVFPRLFPWAKFLADEEFYDEYDKCMWQEYHCYRDEEDNILVVGDSYEKFKRRLNPMRSIDHCGEVAEYQLILELNNLGKSFLEVNEYVSHNQIYTSTRPVEDKEEDTDEKDRT